MHRVAIRNLLAGKARFAFSVAGVAASVLLLSFVLGLYRGWNASFGEYLEQTEADVWVSRVGNESFFAPSVVQGFSTVPISQMEGVRTVSPLLTAPLKLHTERDGYDALLVGSAPAGSLPQLPGEGGLGGPARIVEGRNVATEGEIVVDRVLARQAGLEIGDSVKAGLRTLEIVGLSAGGNVVVGQLCFVTLAEARIILGYDSFYNFLLLETEPGQEDAIADRITREVPGVNAFAAERFVSASKEVLSRNMQPILFVILVISFAVGTIVVALTVYTAVVEKEREFGVLKALGVPGRGLLTVVLWQSLICCVLGFVAGELLTVAAAELAGRTVPQFVTLVRWQDVAGVFGAAILMSVLASVIPANRLSRVDPLSVFKA